MPGRTPVARATAVVLVIAAALAVQPALLGSVASQADDARSSTRGDGALLPPPPAWPPERAPNAPAPDPNGVDGDASAPGGSGPDVARDAPPARPTCCGGLRERDADAPPTESHHPPSTPGEPPKDTTPSTPAPTPPESGTPAPSQPPVDPDPAIVPPVESPPEAPPSDATPPGPAPPPESPGAGEGLDLLGVVFRLVRGLLRG